ncbi:MAG: hypothetical protein IJY27_03395 [Clostridia bacterium]|nr:hypothetical protein [Clostridia bacterium]
MFGYVRAYSPEMKLCEHEYYRAAYCGLCRAMGRCTGCMSRCLLNYDFAFLALVRMSLVGETPEFKKKRCFVHPTKKRTEMIQRGQLDYCACASVLLSYHKVRDDLADERGARRLRARIALVFMRRMHKKASASVPGLDAAIACELEVLAGLERDRCASVDLPASSFGRLTAQILAYGLEGSPAAIARQIGFHVGKWIYIADALDDCESDRAVGRYNPFCELWREGLPPESVEDIRAALKRELMDAELGFNMINWGDDGRLRGVIENIIYCGMPRRAESLARGGEDGDK